MLNAANGNLLVKHGGVFELWWGQLWVVQYFHRDVNTDLYSVRFRLELPLVREIIELWQLEILFSSGSGMNAC